MNNRVLVPACLFLISMTILQCDFFKKKQDSNDNPNYQYVICDFYRNKNGVLFERKYDHMDAPDGGHIYYDSTYGSSKQKRLDSIIDLNTFVCQIDSSGYAKDKYHVYYYHDNSNGGFLFPLDDADPKTFKSLCGYMWGSDGKNVYYQGNILEGASAKKLVLFRHRAIAKAWYSKDDKSVFYEYKKINGADPKTFQAIDPDDQVGDVSYDAFDKNRRYESGEPIKQK